MARFKLKFEGKGKVIEVESGRVPLWEAQDYGDTLPEGTSKSQRIDFAWAFLAVKAAGKLDEFGIPGDASIEEGIAAIADEWDYTATRNDVPLAEEPAK